MINTRKIVAFSILLVLAAGLLILNFSVKATAAAPCTPCSTWGAIKSCYRPSPPACCSCGKSGGSKYDVTVGF